ncbi:glycoside hydrolase family 2 protein [Chryseolinea soli]|uniref:Beta-galactosidase n=1 Tax=Chryseolinea soli TaxID=2321403 RepID=A0A385SNN1_9BACT|nr:glycoside hydrolase family 2 TIM barrel-domain containing protein [Chryseolinea soli]AYB31961.1 beta-galactosidase [Chryseolinea soli]
MSIRTFSLLFICIFLPIVVFSRSPRKTLNFNRDWKFRIGDHAGAHKEAFDDRNWDRVGIPHSFSTPYFLETDFYVGYGWYRKEFFLTKEEFKRAISLEFEGVFQVAEVFVNGNKVGEHKGGYTGFSLEVSKHLREGKNVVAVRVNNLWNARLAPRAGEHVFSGGIYRDVKLVITDAVHVAWYGTFITCNNVDKMSADVNVVTELVNGESVTKHVLVKTELLDPSGKSVASLVERTTILPRDTAVVTQQFNKLSQPILWNLNNPQRYTAVISVMDGTDLMDVYSTRFGIRKIAWTVDKGFFLNNEHVYLRGANVHQDHAGWGDAVSNAGLFRDVKLIKDAGFNFIRGSHYPHDPAFAEACDSLGVLFWSENAFWGIGGSSENPEGYWNTNAYPPHAADRAGFDASVLQQLAEMIRISRNHPSIITWSLCNEPFFTLPATIEPLSNLLKRCVTLVHNMDPTRPAAIGGAQRPLDQTRIDRLGDIAGYNGDGATIEAFQNPGVPSVVSEYGSTIAERPGDYSPGWGDLSKDNGMELHPWRSGQAIWCAFDHGSIAGSRLARMGIIDYFRIPKRSWFWYRNNSLNIPPPAWPKPGEATALVLSSDKMVVGTDGTDDVMLTVTVVDMAGIPIANSPAVTLRVVSGPGQFPTGRSITFEPGSLIGIVDGLAAIEFRSFFAGNTEIWAESAGLITGRLKLSFTGDVTFVEGNPQNDRVGPVLLAPKEHGQRRVLVFGRNNPTFASSSNQGHGAGFATDGSPATWWEPAGEDNHPSLTVHMERGVNVSDVKLEFPSKAIWQYKVEVSDNQTDWTLVSDNMNRIRPENNVHLKVKGVKAGSYLRVSFKSSSTAKLAEIKITGTQDN